MTSVSADLFISLIDALKRNDEAAAVSLLARAPTSGPTFAAMARAATFHSSATPFYYIAATTTAAAGHDLELVYE